MRTFWILSVVVLLSGFAEAQTHPSDSPQELDPKFAVKVRSIPLLSTLASSVAAERLNHSFTVDGEFFFIRHFSASLTASHSRLSVGRSDDDAQGRHTDEYFEEWNFGFLLTYYLSPNFQPGSFYLRSQTFAILADTSRPSVPTTEKVIPSNHGIEPFGLRTGLEVGYALVAEAGLFVDMGAGFLMTFRNPYAPLTGVNKNGVPGEVSSVVFGIADTIPTINLAFGLLF